jgi:hypothetical protein
MHPHAWLIGSLADPMPAISKGETFVVFCRRYQIRHGERFTRSLVVFWDDDDAIIIPVVWLQSLRRSIVSGDAYATLARALRQSWCINRIALLGMSTGGDSNPRSSPEINTPCGFGRNRTREPHADRCILVNILR